MPITSSAVTLGEDAPGAAQAGTDIRPSTGDVRWLLTPHDTRTVTRARTLINGAMTVLGADADVVENTEWMIAELVSNAVRHAREPVELLLRVCDGSAVVASLDGSEEMPTWPSSGVPGGPVGDDAVLGLELEEAIDALRTSGRGLGLVQHLSSGACGACRIEGGRTASARKAVWFAQPLPGGGARHVDACDPEA